MAPYIWVHIAEIMACHLFSTKPLPKDPDSKIHGANVGPTWGRQDPGGPHVGHRNLAIWGILPYLSELMMVSLLMHIFITRPQ